MSLVVSASTSPLGNEGVASHIRCGDAWGRSVWNLNYTGWMARLSWTCKPHFRAQDLKAAFAFAILSALKEVVGRLVDHGDKEADESAVA